VTFVINTLYQINAVLLNVLSIKRILKKMYLSLHRNIKQ